MKTAARIMPGGRIKRLLRLLTGWSGPFLLCIQAHAQKDILFSHWEARRQLMSRGVEPYAVLSSETWGNMSGGLRTGAWYDQLLDFGVRLDTAGLGWWEGGSFLAQGHWVANIGHGNGFAAYTGAFNPVSGIMAGSHIRVFNLHYCQSWAESTVSLKLGQIAVDDDFMLSEYSGLFLNSAFGAMPSQVGTPLATSFGNGPAFPIYSVASPGMLLKVQPAKTFRSQLGLYFGNPGPDTTDNHGFDWVTQSAPALGLFWENAMDYTLMQRAGVLRFGLSYHNGQIDDFNAINTFHTPVRRETIPDYYLVNDFQLLADSAGKSRLGLFCRAGVSPEPDTCLVHYYVDAGLNWFGPLPARPDDIAGVAVSYTKFGESFQKSTGPCGVAADETTVEATYRARITPWMTVQADAQVLLNPCVNPISNQRETAVVMGVRAVISF